MKIKKGQRGRLNALPGGYCASMRTGFDGSLQSVADSVVPVFVFAVATAS